jgi:hypothetical protein
MELLLQPFSGKLFTDQTPEDQITWQISWMVLNEPTDPSQHTQRTTLQEEPDLPVLPSFPIPNSHKFSNPSSVLSAATLEHLPPNVAALLSQDQKDDYVLLWQLDKQLNSHMKDILMVLDKLASPEQSVEGEILCDLVVEEQWLKQTIHQVWAFTATDQVGQLLKDAMLCRLEDFIAAVDCYMKLLVCRVTNIKSMVNDVCFGCPAPTTP